MFLTVPKNSRYEIKFITYEHNYYSVLNWLKLNEFNFREEYENRTVNNIYFDTISYDSYKSNIFGDSSRIKIRYRWYGDIKNSENGNLEIKFKRNLYGWKERYKINKFCLNKNNNWKDLIPKIESSLPLNKKIFFRNYSIPKIINQYSRNYFRSYNGKVRITLDKGHYVFDQRCYNTPNLKKDTFTQRILVMELKFDRSERGELDHLIGSIPIRASRNSKYVNSIRAVTGI